MAVHQRIIGTSQAADSCNFRTNRSAVRAEVEHVPGVVSISRSIYNHIHAAPLRTGDLFDGIFQLNSNSSAGLNQVKVAGEGGGILAQQAFYLQVNITTCCRCQGRCPSGALHQLNGETIGGIPNIAQGGDNGQNLGADDLGSAAPQDAACNI